MDVAWAADDQAGSGITARTSAHAPGHVAGDLQHDIRGAATTIVWLVRVIDSAMSGEDERDRALGGILECAKNISALASAGRERAPVPVPVHDIVRGVVDRTQLAYPGHVSYEFVSAHVVADALDLVRIVENLLANACQAAGADGSVAARVTETTDLVVIEIDDSGPGVRDSDISGGLGLAIVRNLVASLGGTFTFIAVGPGGGTRARVQLPAAHHVVGPHRSDPYSNENAPWTS
jgi:signal transduction histidine kinase